MDAARVMTAGAVDLGEKPSVVSAIVKYHLTERGRQVINDAMDVHGGKGICLGPSNYLARAYQQTPIAITVEGANILTRSMIIFGQGAIRGHPYVLKEIAAVAGARPRARRCATFDAAFFGHVAFVVSNKARALWMGLTGARFVSAPGDAHTRRYYQQLTRLSSAFAFAADVAMFVLGGSLKRRERLSARLGDILSQLYLASCALKRYEDDGRPAEDLPLLHWSLQDALARTEDAFYGLFENLPGRLLPGAAAASSCFPWGREFSAAARPARATRCATLVLASGPARERLTAGMFIPTRRERAGRDARSGARRGDRRGADRAEAARGARERRDRGATAPTTTSRAVAQGVITQRGSASSSSARTRCAARRSWSTIFRRISAGPRSIRRPQPVTSRSARRAEQMTMRRA